MMIHPEASKLDAFAAGDEDAEIAEHLGVCRSCNAYVTGVAFKVMVFRQTVDADAFAAKVKARAAETSGEARPVRPLRKVAGYLAPVLLAAAVLVLFVRTRGRAPEPTVPLHDPRSVASAAAADTHSKGGLAVVAVRDRGGVQERFGGPFAVQPGDRLRVEVALDHAGPLAVGLLFDDGSWTPLLAPTELAAGTHLSELAARFDAAPTDAELLVGPPADVDRARVTRQLDGIVAWRIRTH